MSAAVGLFTSLPEIMDSHTQASSRGKAIVAAFIGAITTAELYIFVLDQAKMEPNPLRSIVKGAITVGIALAIWRGFAWARWLMVVLLALACVYAAVAMFQDFHLAQLAPAFFALVWTVILGTSKSIGEFQRDQRSAKGRNQ